MTDKLDNLPEELLQQIVDNLKSPPPSFCDVAEPSARLFKNDYTPLKSLSSVSRDWRYRVFPILFTHLKVDAGSLLERWLAANMDGIGRTTIRDTSDSIKPYLGHGSLSIRNAGAVVESMCVFVDAEMPDLLNDLGHTGNSVVAPAFWGAMLHYFDPKSIVIVAPPAECAFLISTTSDMSHLWSFDIPYQRVELRRDQSNDARTRNAPRLLTSILEQFRCAYLEFDEGSFVDAYRHYHYFEKYPPSILRYDRFLASYGTLHSLTHICYRAVFPHDPHLMKLMQTFKWPTIRHISLQLAPPPSSSVLNDLDKIGRGNVRLGDCWSEIKKCYELVIDMCLGHNEPTSDVMCYSFGTPYHICPPKIYEFTSYDYHIEDLRETIDLAFKEVSAWKRLETKNKLAPELYQPQEAADGRSTTWKLVD
ncbi:MAG: hypothetical protein M1828_001900 [Chrysothrix sp. TS-e1954]|nr:MAG: hypothetical protein M1828_001900 [Chrysothrix sp. TS-e1954]